MKKNKKSLTYLLTATAIIIVEIILFCIEKYLPEFTWGYIEFVFIALLPLPIFILLRGKMKYPQNKKINVITNTMVIILSIIFLLIVFSILLFNYMACNKF